MLSFLLQRILQGLLVMLVISSIAFYISDHLGDPTREMVGNITSEEERAKLRHDLGLDLPFYQRYLVFLGKVSEGDFGNSYFFKQPVLNVILEKFSATMELVILAVVWILLFSFPVGIFSAVYPKNFLSKFFMTLSILGISVPVFLTAIFLIYLFPIKLGWFYSFGRGDVVQIYFWQTNFLSKSGWLHIILPSFSLASVMIPLFVRLIRSQMMEALESEYIHFARARGISKKRILLVHALKNTLLPVISIGGVQIGIMIAYTILTESVFQWPGMGFMFLEAVRRSDIPLIIAYLIFVGLVFVVTSTLVDLLYVTINPKIKLKNVRQG